MLLTMTEIDGWMDGEGGRMNYARTVSVDEPFTFLCPHVGKS